MTEQVLGFLTGALFGFLLQKSGMVRFDRQVGLLLFKDMTVLKFIFSAILVGSVGLQLLADEKIITLVHLPLHAGVVFGGLLFGVGWALAGFCPTTVLGALGEGRWHAFFVLAGMIFGAGLYAEVYPWFEKTIFAWKDLGKMTLPQVIGGSPWISIAIMWGAGIVSFVWCSFKRL